MLFINHVDLILIFKVIIIIKNSRIDISLGEYPKSKLTLPKYNSAKIIKKYKNAAKIFFIKI